MSRKQVPTWLAPAADGPRLARREFIGAAATATGLVLGSGIWPAAQAQGRRPRAGDPKPIPGGTTLTFNTPGGPVSVRVRFNPGITDQSREALLITDFNGFFAVARNTGTGTGTQGSTRTRLVFSTDVRVMSGVYRDVNNRVSLGTFCFL